MRFQKLRRAVQVGGLLLGVGCGVQDAKVVEPTAPAAPTWEEFIARDAFLEPGTGVWIADGDTPFVSNKALREFYDTHVRQPAEVSTVERDLIVNTVGGADDKWSADVRRQLRYCVSDAFGSRKAEVVSVMAQASAAWSAVADVQFIYDSSQDASCNTSNLNVLFDVAPVNVGGQYIARAFFPSYPRSSREVLFDDSAFKPGAPFTLVGVTRHELGHVLGFRHEHTRPEAGTCFENSAWRALTPYDRDSVMHYPQCNGSGSWALELTPRDEEGALALYGPPMGSNGGADGGTPAPVPAPAPVDAGTPTVPGGGPGTATRRVSGTVAATQFNVEAPLAIEPGTLVSVRVTPQMGDPDLYVRFDAAPTLSVYDCRPYVDGVVSELCELRVPAGAKELFVGTYGYTASTYVLDIVYTPRAVVAGPGSTCADAEPLPVDGTNVIGTTRDLGAAVSPCSPSQSKAHFYRFTLAQRSKLQVDLAQLSTDAHDVELQAVSPGTCSSTGPGSCQADTWADLAAGEYVLTVYGHVANAGGYELRVLATPIVVPSPAGQGESCVGPAPLSLASGVTRVTGSTTGRTHDRTGTCGGGLADVVYEVTLPRAGVVKAIATTTTATYRPVVYLQQATCSTSGSLKCGAAAVKGGAAQFTTASLPAGTYYLWVDGVRSSGATNGDFALDVTLQ